MSPVRSKQLAYRTMYYSGAHVLFRRLTSVRGAVLMFHRVVAEPTAREFNPNSQFAVTADVLATIIETLRATGHEIVSLDEACERMTERAKSQPFACLTFDDGYRDNLELAYPVCARLKAPFAVYVATGFIEGTDPLWSHGLETLIAEQNELEVFQAGHCVHLPTATTAEKYATFAMLARMFQLRSREERKASMNDLGDRYGVDFAAISGQLALTWDMVKKLDQSPGVTIGAHTVSHPALRELSSDDARFEMAESRRVLEEVVHHPIRHFAFPFGDITTTGKREFKLCEELGFATAVTTRHGVLTAHRASNLHALPRIPTDPFDSAQTMHIKLSGLPGALQSLKRRAVRRS